MEIYGDVKTPPPPSPPPVRAKDRLFYDSPLISLGKGLQTKKLKKIKSLNLLKLSLYTQCCRYEK